MMGVTAAARGVANPNSYTGASRVPAILALWLVLVLLASARNRALPDQKHVIALGVATLVLMAVASVAPKIVFYVVLAMVVAVAATNSDTIVNYINAGSAKLKGSFATA